MNLYTHDMPYLLALSLITATTSLIIKPGGRQTFIEDVKWNILSFSPFRSGRMVLHLVIYLIHLRLLNLAEINTILRLISHLEFPSKSPNLEHGLPRSLTRRILLIGGTLPLSAMLLASTSDRWLHGFMACLVAEPILAEVLWFYRESSHDGFAVHRGWPSRMLLATADHFATEGADNEGIKRGSGKKEKEEMEPPVASKDNLCNRIEQLWSNEVDSEITFTSSSLPPQHEANLERILSSDVRVFKWTCGHWRCLVFVISRVAMRIISFAWYIEQGLIIWLLHVDLHPLTLHLSDKVLENNILGGVLTIVYQIARVLILIAGAHLSFRLLFICLTKVERIKQLLQDLAIAAPITYKGIMVFIQLIVPNVLSILLVRATSSGDQSLTRETLSYAMEILVILIICIMGYRLLLEARSNSESSLKAEIAPKSDCDDARNLEASKLRETVSNDKNNAPQERPEYPDLLTSSRFQVFRLAISIPTMIVWVFLRC